MESRSAVQLANRKFAQLFRVTKSDGLRVLSRQVIAPNAHCPMADDKHPFGSRGASKHGSGIIPDADYLLSRARTLFRAARAALGTAERERLERDAHNFERQATDLEKLDRYGAAYAGNKSRGELGDDGSSSERQK